MTPLEIKAAFKQKDVEKPFIVYKDPKEAKPVLAIGLPANDAFNRARKDKSLKIEGLGFCHATEDERLVFAGRQVKLSTLGKTAIKTYCKAAAFPEANVLFHDDDAPSGATDGADGDLSATPPAQTTPAAAPQTTPASTAQTPPPQTRRPAGTFGAQNAPKPVAPAPTANPPPTQTVPAQPAPETRDRAGSFGVVPSRERTGTFGQKIADAPMRTNVEPAGAPPPTQPTPITRPTSGTFGQAADAPPLRPQMPNASTVSRERAKRTLPTAVPPLPQNSAKGMATLGSTEYLATVKKGASRMGMNMGAFDKVFFEASSVGAEAQRFAQMARDPKRNPTEYGTARGELLKKYKSMLGTLQAYDNEKAGPTVSDSMRQTRTNFRNEVEASIKKAIDELHYEQLGDVVKYLEAKNNKAQDGGLTDKEEALYHEKRAEMMLMATGKKVDKAGEGTGDVRLLRNTDGSVAYAFKSLAGESGQLHRQGVAQGAPTGQEILTSKMSDILQAQCGFVSGHPKTTFARLPVSDEGGNANVGVLLEGVPGRSLEDIDPDVAKEQWRQMSPTERDAVKQRAQAVTQRDKDYAASLGKPPKGDAWDTDLDEEDAYAEFLEREKQATIRDTLPKEVQRILLMNLATVNFDGKWGGVMTDGQKMRPIDGGGAMLTAESMKDFSRNPAAPGQKPTGPINPRIGNQMMYIPDGYGGGAPHPVQNVPLDQEFVNQFQSLNLDAIRQELQGAVVSVQGQDPMLAGAISDSNVEGSLKSLEFIKATIEENPRATTQEFLTSYQGKMKVWLESLPAST